MEIAFGQNRRECAFEMVARALGPGTRGPIAWPLTPKRMQASEYEDQNAYSGKT